MSLTSCRALSTPGKFSNVDRYDLFWYMSSREILRDMHLNLARSKFWDFFTKYLWTLHNFVKIIILETCLMIIYRQMAESLFFHLLPLVYQ